MKLANIIGLCEGLGFGMRVYYMYIYILIITWPVVGCGKVFFFMETGTVCMGVKLLKLKSRARYASTT